MGYGNKIFQAACQELERRKRQAEELADRGRERFYEQCPGPGRFGRRWPRTPPGPPRRCFPAGTCGRKSPRMKDRGLAAEGGVQPAAGGAHLTEADVTPQYQCLACLGHGLCGRPHVRLPEKPSAAHGL